MKDNLGNIIEIDDNVIIAVKTGNTASLVRAYVKELGMRPPRPGWPLSAMVRLDYNNLPNWWMIARNVVKIMPDMLPENRIGKYAETEEGIEVS